MKIYMIFMKKNLRNSMIKSAKLLKEKSYSIKS